MKKITLILITLISGISFTNCESNPCDDGYEQVELEDGSKICLPEGLSDSF